MKKIILNGQSFELAYPAVMGILNITPDSFSDGGKFLEREIAVAHALKMHEQGAQIIDIGGESTRPGSSFISASEELDRILPVLRALPKNKFIISVDTNKPEVQEVVLKEGAHIINDILGGNDELFALAEKYRAGLVLMHTSAAPNLMQAHTEYEDVVEDILTYLNDRWDVCRRFDIPAVWMDPGIGFGKTLEQNLALMRGVARFVSPHWGLLLGASRKSWISKFYGVSVEERLGASLGAAVLCYLKGVDIFRVHDVRESCQALNIARILKD